MWKHWSAHRRLTPLQRVLLVALIAAGAGGVAPAGPRPVLAVLLGVGTCAFIVTTVMRVVYILSGRRPAEPAALADPSDDLPRYSVMVALYKEAGVVPALCDAIAALEYPADRLQVLFLVEEDDPDTAAACRQRLRPGWDVVVAPPGVPRTKPRALNVGLPLLDGEFFTIYDAEDRPEPDQLLKAVGEFARQPSSVAALQARLDFYNSHENSLTKWFTCDYATYFGLYLQGVAARRHPLPLGGTSTHFRTEVVGALGGWDPWNVTEDCELGMRLAVAGYQTLTLDSVTWEEAVPKLRPWIRQRSRWVKGFAQTALVLLRRPVGTARGMGLRRYLAALVIVGGVPVVLVSQVIFWALLIVYVALRVNGGDVRPIESVFPEPLLSLGMVSLLIGNYVVIVAHVGEIYRERRFNLVGWALTVPLYWLLASIAAWKGTLQLLSRPHYWEKTQHGLTRQHAPPPMPAGAAPAAPAGPPPVSGAPAVSGRTAAGLDAV